MEDRKKEKFAAEFYASWKWRRVRIAYAKSVGGLCERCKKRGVFSVGTQVHHKIRLTPANIKDPKVALAWSNLELLCDACHEQEHTRKTWRTDEDGHVDL